MAFFSAAGARDQSFKLVCKQVRQKGFLASVCLHLSLETCSVLLSAFPGTLRIVESLAGSTLHFSACFKLCFRCLQVFFGNLLRLCPSLMLCWCDHLVLSFHSLRMLLFKRCLHSEQGLLRLINNFVLICLAVFSGPQDYRQCYLEQLLEVGWQGPRISERVHDI